MDAKGVSGITAGCSEDGLPGCWDISPSVCILDSGVAEEQSPSLAYSENMSNR